MKKELLSKAATACSKAAFALRKRSPEILVTVGVIGTVASAVIACKATIKANDILAETKSELEAVHTCESSEEHRDEYTEDDAKKDKAIIYVQTGVKFLKLYAPAVILGALSLSCIIASNDILRKRNAALAAAYTAVDTGFKEYRNRVAERFGEEVDKELRYNIKAKTITETVTDKNGKEKETARTIPVADPNAYSEYAKIFDESNINYEKDSDYNKRFLIMQQNYANDRLRAKGYLFLNDVYEMLGFERTKAGQIVGWVWDPDNPTGDNYVDFGIFEINREKARDFVNGYERAIVLDFNVDGPILDSI